MKHRLIRYLQRTAFPVTNSFEPLNTPGVKTLENGCILYNDIQYGKTYPNSFVDIYTQPDAKEKQHPTIFYVHGGGYVWGGKVEQDPRKNATDKLWFFKSYLNAGYNLVSMDYAFAPDYPYPTPILQMSEAIEFVKAHAAEYGLDMNCIIFNGGSAGGQLIGQFVNIQTNPFYAEEMGIVPVLDKSVIKAMVFNSALLDNERFNKTDNAVMNYLFNKCGKAYFQCKPLQGNAGVIQSNVIQNATADFPPSFISDANAASFSDQAQDLAAKLDSLEILCKLNIYPKSEVKQTHGFEASNDHYGHDNMQKILEFIQELKRIR